MMDAWLMKFVGENWVTIFVALRLLEGVAKLTPSVEDDKVVTLLSQAYDSIKGTVFNK